MHADGGGTTDIPSKLDTLKKIHPAVNVGVYIGFNAVWEKVVGDKDRHPSDQEFETMQNLIKNGMEAGAWGVSSGLQYVPAFYASTKDVVRVVKAALPWHTVYRSHIRNEYNKVLNASKEDLTIGEKSGLVPVITHIKVVGKANWGDSRQMLNMMKAARANGTYALGDVYPYLAAQTGLTVLLPGWAMDGGFDAMLQRIKKPDLRRKILDVIAKRINGKYGAPSKILLPNLGTNLAEVAQKDGVQPAEALLNLFEQKKHNISAIMFYGAKKDLYRFLQSPMIAISCDCGSTTSSSTHPRYYGSWSKVLGRYVREKHLLTWEQAIRKMTGLPATTSGMVRRGFLAEGMIADITVFDPKTIIDKATYKDPKQYAKGVKYVFVNGHSAIVNRKVTGQPHGKVLFHTRYMETRPMSADSNIVVRGSGSLKGSSSDSTAVSFDLKQKTSGNTSGTFHLEDHDSRFEASLESYGMIQATDLWDQPWAVFTGMVRTNKSDLLQPLLFVIKGSSKDAKVIVRIGNKYKASGRLNTSISIHTASTKADK
jgi:N-acyl-D-aspartate/D-glutamate deacylase